MTEIHVDAKMSTALDWLQAHGASEDRSELIMLAMRLGLLRMMEECMGREMYSLSLMNEPFPPIDPNMIPQ